MRVVSAHCIEHEGRLLYIDKGGRSTGCVKLFTASGLADGNRSCAIRVAPEPVAKVIGIRKYLPLKLNQHVAVGPFDICCCALENETAAVVIGGTYLYLGLCTTLAGLPAATTLLLPAFLPPDAAKITDIRRIIKLLALREVILTGNFAKEWSEALGTIAESIITAETAEQALLF